MTQCAVQKCTSPGQTVFSAELGPNTAALEYLVCEFHLTALNAGEAWTEGDSSGRPVILMGAELPLDVVGWSVLERIGNAPTITLQLGRDGVEETRVQVRWKPEDVAELADWLKQIP